MFRSMYKINNILIVNKIIYHGFFSPNNLPEAPNQSHFFEPIIEFAEMKSIILFNL